VESVQDILEELQSSAPVVGASSGSTAAAAASPEATENPLLDALGYDAVSLDALVARTGWSVPELQVKLLDLELDGAIARLPGGLFQRVATA
jgi:DNA processing protein